MLKYHSLANSKKMDSTGVNRNIKVNSIQMLVSLGKKVAKIILALVENRSRNALTANRWVIGQKNAQSLHRLRLGHVGEEMVVAVTLEAINDN